MTSRLCRNPQSLQNPAALTGTSNGSNISSWYYFSKHYSTYLGTFLIPGGSLMQFGLTRVWRSGLHWSLWFVYMQVVEHQLGHKRETQLEPHCAQWLDNPRNDWVQKGECPHTAGMRSSWVQLLHGFKGLYIVCIIGDSQSNYLEIIFHSIILTLSSFWYQFRQYEDKMNDPKHSGFKHHFLQQHEIANGSSICSAETEPGLSDDDDRSHLHLKYSDNNQSSTSTSARLTLKWFQIYCSGVHPLQ